MNVNDLPRGETKKALDFPHFPTRLQAVVWRNRGLVPVEKLAQVLMASPAQIEELASDMGLRKDDSLCPVWHERGYLTIIRRNWHLLPYEQLLALLDFTPDELAYILKEDDFLWHKLGDMKPETAPVLYAPLTAEETRQTAVLKAAISKYCSDDQTAQDKPFEFLKRYGDNAKKNSTAGDHRSGLRLTYSYSAVYGDPLLNENLDPYPDGLLADYAATGINAVWLQGTLYTLVPWLGESKYSDGWRTRLANLSKLCKKAEKYGIRVYLYLNEPRSMPPDFFETHPDWRGVPSRDGLSFTLCTSKAPVLDALKDGISELFRRVPELGGILTITMSENLTNCCSRPQDVQTPCPLCSKRGPAAVVAELNRALAEGVHRIKPDADFIAWTWGWAPEWDEQAVALLSKDVKLMCVSETALPTDAMGIPGSVIDYSISKVGPGPIALRLWRKAAECGIETIAKVQLNNTWECSAVPYIPVPGLVEKHLRNLEAAGVGNLMLNWTLGGYPGGNLELLKQPKEKLAIEKYGGGCAESVLKAWGCFDRAFVEFPLNSIAQLYTAPQNFGPMNLLFAKPSGYTATMLGLPYDDLDSWRGNHYPEDIFEEQFRKLSTGWADGLEQLKQAREIVAPENAAALADLMNVAEAAYCHFRSTYLQIRFVRQRGSGDSKTVLSILDEEIELAGRLIEVVMRDSRIGFEASNHYYYTAADLKEKILNCELIRTSYLP
ncbi:MAG: hypothetical protein WCV67_16640 [Victivallaceae bacterium]|jgi:hypothetical protein